MKWRSEFISAPTKEALAKRKTDMYLKKKINKRSIAKLLDASQNILYVWLKVCGRSA